MSSMRKLNRRLRRWQRYVQRYRPGPWPRNYNVVRCDVRDTPGFVRAYFAVQHEQERRFWDETAEIHLVGMPDDDYDWPPYVVSSRHLDVGAAVSGDVTTRIGPSYLDPEVKAAARRFLERSGNADMLIPLGLVDDPEAFNRPSVAPRGDCPICGNSLPGHGVCRRSGRCREAAAERDSTP